MKERWWWVRSAPSPVPVSARTPGAHQDDRLIGGAAGPDAPPRGMGMPLLTRRPPAPGRAGHGGVVRVVLPMACPRESGDRHPAFRRVGPHRAGRSGREPVPRYVSFLSPFGSRPDPRAARGNPAGHDGDVGPRPPLASERRRFPGTEGTRLNRDRYLAGVTATAGDEAGGPRRPSLRRIEDDRAGRAEAPRRPAGRAPGRAPAGGNARGPGSTRRTR